MKQNILAFSVVILFLLISCGGEYYPKPRTYPRINFPEKNYVKYDTSRFSFEVPVYSIVEPDTGDNSAPFWLNVHFQPLNASLHLSYKSFSTNKELNDLTEDARSFVYKHAVKAQEIKETLIYREKLYGIFYEIEGNTASALQFYVSDSIKHYMRGSLYFNAPPNRDSLDPAIDFLKEDIIHMLNTLQWK
jgi:gliding motility-associated lipoprotein GldD